MIFSRHFGCQVNRDREGAGHKRSYLGTIGTFMIMPTIPQALLKASDNLINALKDLNKALAGPIKPLQI